eukprot:9502716-Alexandrium_andersonii.AAC.1
MSASLVGSEMCIRDSTSVDSSADSNKRPCSHELPAMIGAGRRKRCKGQAVGRRSAIAMQS